MALSFSIDLRDAEQDQLLAIARRSIHSGLADNRPLAVALEELPEALTPARATFVTLTIDGALRGCIGSLEPVAALAQGVADAAYSAAFRDPRFPQLERHELDRTTIEISVLSGRAPIDTMSRAELLAQLDPGSDGLLIEEGRHRATFLPAVWKTLPSPVEFLSQLMKKAGLPEDHWSATLRCYRYRSVSMKEAEVACNPSGAS